MIDRKFTPKQVAAATLGYLDNYEVSRLRHRGIVPEWIPQGAGRRAAEYDFLHLAFFVVFAKFVDAGIVLPKASIKAAQIAGHEAHRDDSMAALNCLDDPKFLLLSSSKSWRSGGDGWVVEFEYSHASKLSKDIGRMTSDGHSYDTLVINLTRLLRDALARAERVAEAGGDD